jgi:hypothetical protein
MAYNQQSASSSSSSSAAEQLIQKLIQKQSAQEEDDDFLYSPLILLEYSNHVSHRIAAATPTSSKTKRSTATSSSRVQQHQQRQQAHYQAEADLYQRAQLRTPEDNAQRLIWGGPLWFELLSMTLLHQHKNKKNKNPLVWISTTRCTIPSFLLANNNPNEEDDVVLPWVHVIDSTCLYQHVVWDHSDENNDNDDDVSHPLQDILTQLQVIVQSATRAPPPPPPAAAAADTADQPKDTSSSSSSVIIPCSCTSIIVESLTPWIHLYGFDKVLSFVETLLRIPHVLVLLPVLTENTSLHHQQQLEDLAHTCLWLSNHTGQVEMHVLRQGIREQDNRVRELWDFTLVHTINNNHNMPFRLSVGAAAEAPPPQQGEAPPDQVNLVEVMNPALTTEHSMSTRGTTTTPIVAESSTTTTSTTITTTNKRTNTSNKITLKFEEDNDNKPGSSRTTASSVKPTTLLTATTTPTTTVAVPTRTNTTPRIFLQDNDPEYEDYDSDDPDDDLDI